MTTALALPATGLSQAPELVLHSERPAWIDSPERFLRYYLSKQGITYPALLIAVVGASVCAVGVQYGMKLLVDAMVPTAGTRVVSEVTGALAVFIALIGFESMLWRASSWLTCRATVRAGIDIRLDLFSYLSGHSLRFFNEQRSGALGHRVTDMAGSFGLLSNRMVWDVAPPVIAFIGATIIFSTFDWRMTAALGIFFIGVTGALMVVGRMGRPLHRAYSREAGHASGELIDVLTNIWSVKAFSARGRERARLADQFNVEAVAHQGSWLFVERVKAVHDMALVAMAGGTLWWAVTLWSTGKISAGGVVLISGLTFRILYGSRDLAIALVDMEQQLGRISETLLLFDEPQSVADVPDARTLPPAHAAVRFEGVTFGYDDARPILHDLTLEIAAGQKVGIVGSSGAGKSTVLQLVQRLYDVQHGRVLIGGVPVGDLAQDTLRDMIAVVPQEITLFHRSIIDNIRFGRPDATDDEVYAAAAAARCDGFIKDLPLGYHELVGERGTRLSGGQRQRIGIARAFLKNAPIVILDEATSALDTASEREVQAAIDDLMDGRTVIAVAHRLSTLANFDRILVIEGGRVIEDGAPQDLRRLGGPFDTMWRLQVAGLTTEAEARLMGEQRDPHAPPRRHQSGNNLLGIAPKAGLWLRWRNARAAERRT